MIIVIAELTLFPSSSVFALADFGTLITFERLLSSRRIYALIHWNATEANIAVLIFDKAIIIIDIQS